MDDPAGFDKSDLAYEQIGREATSWLIRLDDEPEDLEVRDAFFGWLAADERHVEAWDETLAVVATIARARPVSTPIVSPLSQRPARPRLQRIREAWPITAIAAVAASVAWFAVPTAVLELRADHLSRTAEVRAVALSDGSKVTLAPGSAINVTFGRDGRDVHLLRGEAFFDVVHDASRPFRVRAGESQTRVLGTAFDVKLLDGQADVSVSRGAVEVSLPDRVNAIREVLTFGQTLRLNWQGGARRAVIRADRVAAWRRGQMIVDDQPVGAVIAALRPWYKGYIIARGDGLSIRRVTGVYDLRHPDAALEALGKAQSVQVRRISPWLRIVTVD